MSIFKCKMCGGTIEFEQGATIGVCDSCGTKQTLPHLDDDRRSNLYDRANHFRRNNEFDKASTIYEQILNEDKTDSEAYWSLVLCQYGIEYVEDPSTHKRVPTVNRAQFTSIFDDENYKSALQYADGSQKEIYEEEAKVINEIQKGILSISQKEEPFDVFICYKETDANGRRTIDSVLANELYHGLVQEGFKVFFARITLEDKLGTAYEPYIFAALNSAKVMVVLGTKPEYFNAVWVKNEWSRYISLVKKSSGQKVLIPAYKDMDPYDLPEEFSHLQAQDMSKLGFMQDLIRGIKKIAKNDEPKPVVKETVVIGGNANVAPLLKRAFIFLEDGDWSEADTYCEKVLDQDPENAQAYLGKLMAELKVHKQEDLANCKETFEDNSNYQKAIRFGNDKQKNILNGYINIISKNNEIIRQTGIYNVAIDTMTKANNETSYKSVAEMFKTISNFKDSNKLYQECLDKAENCRKNDIYKSAKLEMSRNTILGCEKAISILGAISGWRDVDEQINICRKKIDEIKAKEEVDGLERARKAEERRISAEKAAKKRKKIASILIPIIIVCIAFAILLTTVIIPSIKYSSAINLYNEGKYDEAITAFKALNGYKDSTEQITKCENAIKDTKYDAAIELYNAKKYDEAITAFKALNGYKDSVELIKKCNKENLKIAKVGDYVIFGKYEQDYNTSNGKEDIEWLVLAKEDNKLLVISRYALDCQKYNTSNTIVTWETCWLRKWLNGTFMNAFSTNEQKMIRTTTVTADKNPSYNTSPGDNTKDKVFLLSITEANKYFSSDSARKCQGTTYCYAQGANKAGNGSFFWWLRSPGNYSNGAAGVYGDGSVNYFGINVLSDDGVVRPALWIDIGE